jgi:putative spermidine/putrescine transport system permease protein
VTTVQRVRGRAPAALGLLPFFAFVVLFLLWPAATVFWSAAGDGGRHLTEAVQGQYRASFWASLRLSTVTALVGAVAGTAIAYAVVVLERPRWLRSTAVAFAGVAANLGGIPLAFAFITVLGNQGLLTIALRDHGIELLDTPFRLYGFWGLALVYLYFQIPLMVLVMLPAIDGLQPAWREAAANLGAPGRQYWRHVGLPILTPAALGGLLLLFANAFSAYATAYALTTGSSNLVPVQIRFFLQGNTITGKGELGYALAAWMIVVMTVCMTGYLLLRRRTARWLR